MIKFNRFSLPELNAHVGDFPFNRAYEPYYEALRYTQRYIIMSLIIRPLDALD